MGGVFECEGGVGLVNAVAPRVPQRLVFDEQVGPECADLLAQVLVLGQERSLLEVALVDGRVQGADFRAQLLVRHEQVLEERHGLDEPKSERLREARLPSSTRCLRPGCRRC